jgi:hypothetical protein
VNRFVCHLNFVLELTEARVKSEKQIN